MPVVAGIRNCLCRICLRQSIYSRLAGYEDLNLNRLLQVKHCASSGNSLAGMTKRLRRGSQESASHFLPGGRPMQAHPKGARARVLLSSVFGPYAQDDEFGSRSINPMELYH